MRENGGKNPPFDPYNQKGNKMKFICLRYPKLQMTFKTEIRREVNGELFKEPAVIIQFQDGYYETDNEKQIAYIKRHKDFNILIKECEVEKHQNTATEEKTKIIEKSIIEPRKVD